MRLRPFKVCVFTDLRKLDFLHMIFSYLFYLGLKKYLFELAPLYIVSHLLYQIFQLYDRIQPNQTDMLLDNL